MKQTPQRARIVLGCSLLLSLLVLSGCGGGNKKDLILKGKVNYKGEIVPGGTVTLTPTDTKLGATEAKILGDGTYMMVPPGLGEMKVTIETESLRGQVGGATGGYAFVPPGASKDGKMPEMQTNNKLPKYRQIPGKYAKADTSGLTITIKKGPNEHTFDLSD